MAQNELTDLKQYEKYLKRGVRTCGTVQQLLVRGSTELVPTRQRPNAAVHCTVKSEFLGNDLGNTWPCGSVKATINERGYYTVSRGESEWPKNLMTERRSPKGDTTWSIPSHLMYTSQGKRGLVTRAIGGGILPPGFDCWALDGNVKRLANAAGKGVLAQLLTYCYEFMVCDFEWVTVGEKEQTKQTLSDVCAIHVKLNPLTHTMIQSTFRGQTQKEIDEVVEMISMSSRRIPVFFDDAAQDVMRMEEIGCDPMWGFSPLFPVGVWSMQSLIPVEVKRYIPPKHTALDDTIRDLLFLTDFYLDTVFTIIHICDDLIFTKSINSESEVHNLTEKIVKRMEVRSAKAYDRVNSVLKSLRFAATQKSNLRSVDYFEFKYPRAYGIEEEDGTIEMHYIAPEGPLRPEQTLKGDMVEVGATIKLLTTDMIFEVARREWFNSSDSKNGRVYTDIQTWVTLQGYKTFNEFPGDEELDKIIGEVAQYAPKYTYSNLSSEKEV